MGETVLAALITGGLALVGVIYSGNVSQRKTQAAVETTLQNEMAGIKTEIAVTKNEIKNLRVEVEKHNSFATRIPALEAKEQANESAIKRLENFHME